jgi:hypothetical protein
MSINSHDDIDEGFFKPTIEITEPKASFNLNHTTKTQDFEHPIDILAQERPLDFKPRFLVSETDNQYLQFGL